MEWLLGLSPSGQALDDAPTLAAGPFPACGRPIRTQPGAIKQPSLCPPIPPSLHQTVLRAAPEPRRSLAGDSP